MAYAKVWAPDRAHTAENVLWVCPRCRHLPGMIRVKKCDACHTYQVADGGQSFTLDHADDDDTLEVLWLCRRCRTTA